MRNTLKIAITALGMIGATHQALASQATSAATAALNGGAISTTQTELNQPQPNVLNTTTRYATQGHPDSFVFHQTQRGPVTLQSHPVAGAENPAYQLSAVVLDEQGQVVAQDDHRQGGDFRIQQVLEPGTYVLKVEGAAMQSASNASTSYQVSASL